MGIVHSYLLAYECSEKTVQLALSQVFNNLHKCALVDVAIALQSLMKQDNDNLRKKYIKQLDTYIQIMSVKLTKGINLNGVLMIMGLLHLNDDIKLGCWNHLEKLLEAEILKRRDPFTKAQALELIQILARQRLVNEKVWQ